jgi:hypothetical protein
MPCTLIQSCGPPSFSGSKHVQRARLATPVQAAAFNSGGKSGGSSGLPTPPSTNGDASSTAGDSPPPEWYAKLEQRRQGTKQQQQQQQQQQQLSPGMTVGPVESQSKIIAEQEQFRLKHRQALLRKYAMENRLRQLMDEPMQLRCSPACMHLSAYAC